MRRLLVVLTTALVFAGPARAWTWPASGPVLLPFDFDPAHPYGGGQHRGYRRRRRARRARARPCGGDGDLCGHGAREWAIADEPTADGWSVTLTELGSIAVAGGVTVAEGDVVGIVGAGVPASAGRTSSWVCHAYHDQGYALHPQSLLPLLLAAGADTGVTAAPPPAPAAAPAPDASVAPAPDASVALGSTPRLLRARRLGCAGPAASVGAGPAASVAPAHDASVAPAPDASAAPADPGAGSGRCGCGPAGRCGCGPAGGGPGCRSLRSRGSPRVCARRGCRARDTPGGDCAQPGLTRHLGGSGARPPGYGSAGSAAGRASGGGVVALVALTRSALSPRPALLRRRRRQRRPRPRARLRLRSPPPHRRRPSPRPRRASPHRPSLRHRRRPPPIATGRGGLPSSRDARRGPCTTPRRVCTPARRASGRMPPRRERRQPLWPLRIAAYRSAGLRCSPVCSRWCSSSHGAGRGLSHPLV